MHVKLNAKRSDDVSENETEDHPDYCPPSPLKPVQLVVFRDGSLACFNGGMSRPDVQRLHVDDLLREALAKRGYDLQEVRSDWNDVRKFIQRRSEESR